MLYIRIHLPVILLLPLWIIEQMLWCNKLRIAVLFDIKSVLML